MVNKSTCHGRQDSLSSGKITGQKLRSQELIALWDASEFYFGTDWQSRRNEVSHLHMSPSFECDYRTDCATSEITWFYNCTSASKRLTVSHNKELPSLLDYALKFRVKNKLLQNKYSSLEYSKSSRAENHVSASSKPISEPWRWRWSQSRIQWVWMKTQDAAVSLRERYWKSGRESCRHACLYRWQISGQQVESSWNVMAHGDAREGEVEGKLANGVGSQYPSHDLGTWCIQHYYRWCAHLGCQCRLNWNSRRFKWTRPFRRKTKSGFCACAITFQTPSTHF